MKGVSRGVQMVRLTKSSFILLLIFCSGLAFGLESFPRIQLELKGKLYDLEVADTDARKSQGLMYRASIRRDAGMLFTFDRPTGLYIWMKNTRMPLTVLWLNEYAEVIHKERLQPCTADPCPSFGPDQPARYVLELHADEWSRFKLGDRLEQIARWY